MNIPLKFGKDPVNRSEEKIFIEKVYKLTRTWLSLYKSIIDRIIKEIRIHKFNLPKFYVLCILAMRLHKAPREVTCTDF